MAEDKCPECQKRWFERMYGKIPKNIRRYFWYTVFWSGAVISVGVSYGLATGAFKFPGFFGD